MDNFELMGQRERATSTLEDNLYKEISKINTEFIQNPIYDLAKPAFKFSNCFHQF